MEKVTRQEINYLINLLERQKRGGFKTRDVEVEIARLDETDVYFLQQKLEKLK